MVKVETHGPDPAVLNPNRLARPSHSPGIG
jgi:hypothetical protein